MVFLPKAIAQVFVRSSSFLFQAPYPAGREERPSLRTYLPFIRQSAGKVIYAV